MKAFLVCLIGGVCFLSVILPVHCGQCSTFCTSCKTSTPTTCNACNDGYYPLGSGCEPCYSTCATCSNGSSCTTCKPGHYSPSSLCISECPANCLNGLCADNTGYCTRCLNGRYGYRCDFDCKLCKNEDCELRHCTDGCKAGYWQYQTGDHSECRPCVDNCLSCVNYSTCNECVDGFFLSQISHFSYYCQACPLGCEICSDINLCSVCKPGYYGGACQWHCSDIVPGCNTCKWDGSPTITCNQCDSGWILTGNTCVKQTPQCPENCVSCSIDNVCVICEAGWIGDLCDISCSNAISHCASCQKQNDVIICTSCEAGYLLSNAKCRALTTTTLSKTSSSTTSSTSSSSISSSEGSPTPKQPTTSALSIVTSKQESSAITPTVTKSSSTSEIQGQSSEQSGDNTIVIGASAGGAGFVLIATVTIILFLMKRRKSNPRNDLREIETNREPMEESLADYPVYAKPNKPKSPVQAEDYIYAQPNKVKKNNKPATYETAMSETNHQYNNVAISLDMEPVVTDTDVDEITLETLEGELTTHIDKGTNIPTSDTYYNVEGLLRSRVDVQNLLEYVRTKLNYDTEFQKLPKGLQRSCDEARKTNNLKKNRYNGIYAYDATRVVLASNSYINANFIDGHNQQNAYIASLGPTSDTMNKFCTFWEMIWKEKVEAIVMLTNLEERGKMKCEQYWPDPGITRTYIDYSVHSDAEHVYGEFTVRELSLHREGRSDKRSVKHYHYTAWPDRYVPSTVASLVEFRDKVEQTKRSTKSPLVVHCSAGIGRTGTYIALDLLIKEGRTCNYVDMFGCALGLRGQRVSLIQNEEQYEYLHHAVLYSLICHTEPVPRASAKQLINDDRITDQFKALKVLPVPSKRLSAWTSNHTDRKENRTGADIPSDSHRVRLQFSKNDYINAVFINSYLRLSAYIAAQTPMPNTVEDFISMIHAERCSCVVSLDDDTSQLKSVAQYLPALNGTLMFGQYQIQCDAINTGENFIVRDIVITKSPTDQLRIKHNQFIKWSSDEMVPASTSAFLNLVQEVNSTVKCQPTHGPVLVHCMTGSERCGVFCAVSTMIEKLTVDGQISGAHTICHIRSRRSTALQNQEMVKFCYHCVTESIHTSRDRQHCGYYNVTDFKH